MTREEVKKYISALLRNKPILLAIALGAFTVISVVLVVNNAVDGWLSLFDKAKQLAALIGTPWLGVMILATIAGLMVWGVMDVSRSHMVAKKREAEIRAQERVAYETSLREMRALFSLPAMTLQVLRISRSINELMAARLEVVENIRRYDVALRSYLGEKGLLGITPAAPVAVEYIKRPMESLFGIVSTYSLRLDKPNLYVTDQIWRIAENQIWYERAGPYDINNVTSHAALERENRSRLDHFQSALSGIIDSQKKLLTSVEAQAGNLSQLFYVAPLKDSK